jgi:hypothetical protein
MAQTFTKAQQQERAVKLRSRYSANRCICGRPKRMREPFCQQDMGVLGALSAPRPLLRGELDDPETAKAYEQCLEMLQQQGYVREGATL